MQWQNTFRKVLQLCIKIAFPVDPYVTEVLPQQISNSNNRVENCHSFKEQPDGEYVSWQLGNVFFTKNDSNKDTAQTQTQKKENKTKQHLVLIQIT